MPAFSPRGTHCWLLLFLLRFARLHAVASQANDEVTPEVQNLYAQAKAARQRGDNATAIEKYRAMIKLAPHLAAAYNNLGMIYFDDHDYAHAVEFFSTVWNSIPICPVQRPCWG